MSTRRRGGGRGDSGGRADENPVVGTRDDAIIAVQDLQVEYKTSLGTVNALNGVDPSITLACLKDRVSVKAGDMVATFKIIPLAVDGDPCPFLRRRLCNARHYPGSWSADRRRPFRQFHRCPCPCRQR